MEENKTIRNQCSFCAHNNVCKFTDDMERFTNSVTDSYLHSDRVESFIDHVDITCRQFDKKPTSILRSDISP